MTTTSAPPPAASPAPGSPQHAPARTRRKHRTVPGNLRLLLIVLVAAAVAYGAVGTWTVIQHASAAQNVVSTSEPLSLAAQRMYQALSDADVTATTSFLIGPNVRLPARQRYAADIHQAAADLTSLENATTTSANPQLVHSLAAVAASIPMLNIRCVLRDSHRCAR